MKTFLLFLVLIAIALMTAIALLPVSADGAGGSITYCTVKQPDGRLQLCTPIPGFQAAFDNDHHHPTPTHRPKRTKTPTPTPFVTPIGHTCTRFDPRQGEVPCPALPGGYQP